MDDSLQKLFDWGNEARIFLCLPVFVGAIDSSNLSARAAVPRRIHAVSPSRAPVTPFAFRSVVARAHYGPNS